MVTIRINLDDANDSPKFSSQIYNASVEENQSKGVHVITVTATDIDQQAANRQFSYAVEDDYGLFHINPNSGKITTTGVYQILFYYHGVT